MEQRPEHPQALAMGFSEAGMFLRQTGSEGVAAVISICGKGECAVDAPGVARRLLLRFDDVDVVDEQDQLGRLGAWARRKWEAEIGREQRPPTEEDARAIVQFALAVKDVAGIVLCHCSGGVSRSPAAALICLAAWKGQGREAECVEELMRARPSATPLRTLVAMGDRVLGHGGRLIEAMRRPGQSRTIDRPSGQ